MSVASWAIRYAASLPGVMMVLSGMSNMEQLEDNTSYMQNFKPLDDKEMKVIENAVKTLHASVSIPCTACKYCVDGCPQKINIPGVFSAMNNYTLYNNLPGAKGSYQNAVKDGGKAGDCIGCGQCEKACPQHLPIREYLRQVSATFDRE